MRIDAAFPSKYLKSADLNGRTAVVKIANVRMEEVEKGKEKPILYFVGKDKGMVLNKANSATITMLYGPETDDWTGSPLELFVALVDFQGKQTEAIRVRAPRPQGQPRPAPVREPEPAYADRPDLDDDIPF